MSSDERRRLQATIKEVQAGDEPPARLYIAGHSVRLGYAVRIEFSEHPPVRFYRCTLRRVRLLVERFNRLAARAR